MSEVFQLPLTLGPIAVKLNAEFVQNDATITKEAAFASARTDYSNNPDGQSGDPNANFIIPNTTLPYNQATLVQKEMVRLYQQEPEFSLPPGQTLDQVLAAYPGDDVDWNRSIVGWGLVKGVTASPLVEIVKAIDIATGATFERAVVVKSGV